MEVTVKLYATLRQGRFASKPFSCPEGTRCRDILAQIELSEKELGACFINSRHGSMDERLNEGDTLSFFPLVSGG